MKFEIREFPQLVNPETLCSEFSYRITLKPEIERIGSANFTGDFALEKITEEDFEEIVNQLKDIIFQKHGRNYE